jgi:hypothetical protein
MTLLECYLSVFDAFDVCLRSCAKVAWTEARELRDKNHRRQALLAYDLAATALNYSLGANSSTKSASTALNYSLGRVGQHRDGGVGDAVKGEEEGGGVGGGHDDRLAIMDSSAVRDQVTLVTAERLRLMEELYGQVRVCGDGSQVT